MSIFLYHEIKKKTQYLNCIDTRKLRYVIIRYLIYRTDNY